MKREINYIKSKRIFSLPSVISGEAPPPNFQEGVNFFETAVKLGTKNNYFFFFFFLFFVRGGESFALRGHDLFGETRLFWGTLPNGQLIDT